MPERHSATLVRRAGLALMLVLLPSAVLSESCRRAPDPSRRAERDCGPSERPKPYEPEAAKAGRERGFIDLGQGTELRVGGSVRIDYGVRR